MGCNAYSNRGMFGSLFADLAGSRQKLINTRSFPFCLSNGARPRLSSKLVEFVNTVLTRPGCKRFKLSLPASQMWPYHALLIGGNPIIGLMAQSRPWAARIRANKSQNSHAAPNQWTAAGVMSQWASPEYLCRGKKKEKKPLNNKVKADIFIKRCDTISTEQKCQHC